jgi:ApaG protein
MAQAFEAVTQDITVRVQVFYLAEQSAPETSEYKWAYHVTIINARRGAVQLLRRSWHITDAQGRVQHVHGEGVVGEQPVLAAGERYEYTSGTPLGTPSGFMGGQYHMQELPSGDAFDVEIPTFSLDSPFQNTSLN